MRESLRIGTLCMVLKNINPLTCDRWNDWIKAEGRFSFFHTSEWAHVLSKSYGFRPHYLISTSHDRISALLPFMEIDSVFTGRRGVSLPFSDYCDPFIGTDIDPSDVMSAATQYADERGWRYLDFHGGETLLHGAPTSSEYVGHRLILSENCELNVSRFKASTRRSIRKAVQSGVEVEITRTQEALTHFYRLQCLTRKRHGLPVQPIRFFQNIYDRILSQNLGHILLALHNGKTCGAAMFFHFGDQALFKFGASDLNYQRLRVNNLIFDKAINWSAANGYKTLDFGRTKIDNTGLRRFKSGWGAEEYPIRYYKYDVKQQVFVKDTSGGVLAVMKPAFTMMPMPISRFIGAALYRHVG